MFLSSQQNQSLITQTETKLRAASRHSNLDQILSLVSRRYRDVLDRCIFFVCADVGIPTHRSDREFCEEDSLYKYIDQFYHLRPHDEQQYVDNPQGDESEDANNRHIISPRLTAFTKSCIHLSKRYAKDFMRTCLNHMILYVPFVIALANTCGPCYIYCSSLQFTPQSHREDAPHISACMVSPSIPLTVPVNSVHGGVLQ